MVRSWLAHGAASRRITRETDPRKVQLAILLRSRTSVGHAWIAEQLAMGHPGSVSRSASAGRTNKETLKNADKPGNLLKYVL